MVELKALWNLDDLEANFDDEEEKSLFFSEETIVFVPQAVDSVDGVKKAIVPERFLPRNLNALELLKNPLTLSYQPTDGVRVKNGEFIPIPFSPAVVFENDTRSVVVADLLQTSMLYVVSLFPERVNFSLRKEGRGFVPTCINSF